MEFCISNIFYNFVLLDLYLLSLSDRNFAAMWHYLWKHSVCLFLHNVFDLLDSFMPHSLFISIFVHQGYGNLYHIIVTHRLIFMPLSLISSIFSSLLHLLHINNFLYLIFGYGSE